jgi:hypothetical protein
MATRPTIPAAAFCGEPIVSIEQQPESAECILRNGIKVRLSRLLANHLAPGDELNFALPAPSGNRGIEVHITKKLLSGQSRELYQAPIGYVTAPKKDKRGQFFVTAEIHGALGIASVFLSCSVLREYFYRLPDSQPAGRVTTLYEVLRSEPTASPAELRLAFKLRALELDSTAAGPAERIALERAFNILAQPELRACYDRLLADPDAPALFPYGGFGSLLVAGERSRDGCTFFAHRILAFLPECRPRRFRASLRKCDFYEDRVVYHDARRQLQAELDYAALHLVWDATWNQWKHLLGTKLEIDGTFVRSGKYRHHRGRWNLVTWETALPSRLAVKLPSDINGQVEAAREQYHRLGQYSKALEQMRTRLEYHAVEKTELEKMCSTLRLPGDIDIAQISWRPDYDPFFYRQLARRARRTYLFRDEYIFDLEKAAVVETPQVGHASYIFAKPQRMDHFLALYTRITKEDIRRNRENVAEKLGFLGRVIHGSNPRSWLREMKQRVGEKMDFTAAADAEVA